MTLFSRGQISIEVMYSVGVMMVIFLILNGISFSWRLSSQDTHEYLDKRNECWKIADYLTSTALVGDGTSAEFYARYDTDILDSGAVVVGEVGAVPDPDAVSASCTFLAELAPGSQTPLTALQTYRIENVRGRVRVKLA